jgi:hypothetical protein
MIRFSLVASFLAFSAASNLWGCQPPIPEPPQPGDSLTAKVGSPEHKAISAIFETWNSTHTRARAAIKMQTDRYRAKKEPVPPVVHYAAALVMMQIGAHAAPDVESVHLAKVGDHPLAALARSRIALREDDAARAAKEAESAVGDKRAGILGEAMKEAVSAVGEPKGGKRKGKSRATRSETAEQVLGLIDDAKTKLNEDLEDERAEMRLLDSRFRASGEELARLQRELNWIQNQTAGILPNGFTGYYSSVYERAAAITRCQQRIAAVEQERRNAQVRHAELKKYEQNEVAKATWRMWSARLPWNVDEERKRLLAGKSAEDYYSSQWEYKPSLPTEFPKQIPKPYMPNRRKK